MCFPWKVICRFCNPWQGRRLIQYIVLAPLVLVSSLSFSVDVFANDECSAPTNITPAANSSLALGNQMLSWDDTGCEYWVYAGISADDRTYDDSASLGEATTYTIDGYPSDGSDVVATLYYRSLTGGAWDSVVVDYIAPLTTESCSVPTNILPATNTTLTSGSQELSWDDTDCEYWVYAGTGAGSNAYDNSRSLGAATSYTFDGYPLDGSDVIVTLYYRSLNAGQWDSVVLEYTAPTSTAGCTVPTNILPTTGTTLTSDSVEFSWDDTDCEYWVYAGTGSGSNAYDNSTSLGQATSFTVSGYPLDGSTFFVTLYYRDLTGGAWDSVVIEYIAPGNGGTCTVPTNISPADGSTLSSATQELSWDDSGCIYWVYAGTEPKSLTYDDSNNLGDSTNYTFSGYPVDGSEFYVTLWYRQIAGGTWNTVVLNYDTEDAEEPSGADLIINEFLADNNSDMPVGNGGEDWIEIYNNENVAVSLTDWCLQDGGEKWCFPDDAAATIPANGYHVVIASGDGDQSTDPLFFHTNFKLSKGGEFLGLYEPDNAIPVDFYDPFPEQEENQSYGKIAGGQQSAYLLPTPNAENQELPVLNDSLSFNFDALTLYGNDRLVTLSADDAAGLAYSLEVSDEAASWLSAATAAGEDGLLTSDNIAISVDVTGLSVGSYIGVVTAQVNGFEQASIEVNLMVPDAPGDMTDWEIADVRIAGLSMPVDTDGGRVFYSLGPDYSSESQFSGNLTYNEAGGYSVGFNNEAVISSASSVSFANLSYASDTSVQLYENGTLLESYDIVWSNLPIVSMKAESIVDEPDKPGTFQFVSGKDSVSTVFYNMGVEYRGGTAQNYPKKPYKIEFVDSPDLDMAGGLDVQFPGLRDDDDWILDAAYRDTTFVRNLVSMDMWNDIRSYAYLNEDGDPEGQPALKGDLVEVILNNEYYGVHALQETVDRKLLNLTKGTDSALFKAVTNFATFEYLSSVREDFEQKYPDYPEIDNYAAVEALILLTTEGTDQEFIDGIGDMIDMDSAVDYWIFNVAIMAVDNVKKNYFIYRENTGLFYFAPWDMDATFGMLWNGAEYPNDEYWPDANGGDCLPANAPNCSLLFSRLNSTSPEFKGKLVARWNELKNSIYTVQSVSDRFQPYLDQLVPIENDDANAFTRNKDRWPGSGGAGVNNPELGTVDWIADFFFDRRDYVDLRINAAQ